MVIVLLLAIGSRALPRFTDDPAATTILEV